MYERDDIAAGYAYDRPPVHERILGALGLRRVRVALDVGCGAGLSAVAVGGLADVVVGVEPRWGEDPGYAMDPRELPFEAAGLRLMSFVEWEVPVRMTLERYARYLRTEGGPEAERWCRETLATVFDGSSLDVIFDTYAVCAGHDARVIAC